MANTSVIVGSFIAFLTVAAPLHSQSVANYRVGAVQSNPPFVAPGYGTEPLPLRGLTRYGVDQVLRWGDVGRCVANADRQASVAFVTAQRGSNDAAAAALRLSPVFDVCFQGSGVTAPKNKALRRAAIADALHTLSSARVISPTAS